jgi:hypothetical protein
MLAFKHGELLAKSQVLQQQASACAENAGEYPEPEPKQVNHDGKVITGRTLFSVPLLLISKPDGIVAIDYYWGKQRSGNVGLGVVGRSQSTVAVDLGSDRIR